MAVGGNFVRDFGMRYTTANEAIKCMLLKIFAVGPHAEIYTEIHLDATGEMAQWIFCCVEQALKHPQ